MIRIVETVKNAISLYILFCIRWQKNFRCCSRDSWMHHVCHKVGSLHQRDHHGECPYLAWHCHASQWRRLTDLRIRFDSSKSRFSYLRQLIFLRNVHWALCAWYFTYSYFLCIPSCPGNIFVSTRGLPVNWVSSVLTVICQNSTFWPFGAFIGDIPHNVLLQPNFPGLKWTCFYEWYT